jgi:hypothetical protein
MRKNIEAGFAVQEMAEHDRIDVALGKPCKTGFTVCREVNPIAASFQVAARQHAERLVVVDV